MALSEKYLKKAKAALASAKDSGSTTMSRDLLLSTAKEVIGQNLTDKKLATSNVTASKLNDKVPYRYSNGFKDFKDGFKDFKKGGKVKRKPRDGRVKKAKCRDGIAIRGKTKGAIK